MPYNTETQAKETLDTIYHYTSSRWDWIDCNVNQMWIQDLGGGKYVAVAYNPRKNVSTIVSNPRGYKDTLHWVRGWCSSFCILPEYA